MSAPLRVVSLLSPQPVAPPAAVECPLCGYNTGHFAGGCASCPMGGGCSSLTCARCGYRFVQDGRWRARLERWSGWARRRLSRWA